MRFSFAISAAILSWASQADASCAWPRRETLQLSGEIQQGGLHGTFDRTTAPASGRFTESVDLGVIKTGSGFNDRYAWSRDVSGASHYLNSDFARRLAVSEAWLSSHLSCRAPRSQQQVQETDLAFDHQRFTPPKGAPIDLWYDRKSGLLDRAELQYPENRLIHHYSDWRDVGGAHSLPFVRRDEDPEDESETVYTTRKVTPVKVASFAPPPQPHDSHILEGTSTTIPFEDDNRHRVYLPVYLNGKGPFTFELDNGGHFILTKETAAALGLMAQGSFASTGAGNDIKQSGYVPITSLRVGAAEVTDQTAKVLPLSHNDRGNLPPRAGVLGLEFFERFVVAVDHRTRTVTLRVIGESPPGYPRHPLPLLFDEDAALVAGSFEGVKGNVMLDIGNAGATIIEHDWATRHGLTAKLAGGIAHGLVKLSKGTVELGPLVLTGETVAYYGPAERGSEYTRSVAAVAGEPLLSRFNAVYDYGHGRVWLDPLPDVPPLSFDSRP